MAITITRPQAYQVFKRTGGVADIAISGTYTGSPTTIEASWNGGAYTTIVASPAGGVYSGTLANQASGQGALSVRFSNDFAQNATVNFVGVGDVYFVIGQSNAAGSGAVMQNYTHPTLKAAMWTYSASSWAEMADPVVRTGGSCYPLLATLYMASASVPFATIGAALGSTSLVVAGMEWQRGNSSYSTALSILAASGVNGVTAILWLQGESETNIGTTQAAYQTALSQMLDDFQADSPLLAGVKMICGQVDGFMTATRDNLDIVRAAEAYCWDNDPDILAGPVLYDIDLTDSPDFVHFGNGIDGQYEQQTLANRWWRMIRYHILGNPQGRGYRFAIATSVGAIVTVQLSGGVTPLVGQSDIRGWRVTDGGVPVGIVTATGDGTNRVRLTLAATPSTTGPLRVSFGSGIDALNTTLMDSAAYPQPPEPFVNKPVTILPDTTSTVLNPNFAFYVDIENAAGTKLGSGPLTSTTKWQYTSRFDRAGTIAFDFSANDPQVAHVANRNVARAWALLNGTWTEVGAGRVDKIDVVPGADGSVVISASGDDLMTELRDRTVGNLKVGTGSGVTHESALNTISAYAPDGWIFTPAEVADNDYFYARFGGESVLGALVDLADKTQTHFYRAPGRELVFASAFDASGIRAIQANGDLSPQTCAITSLRQTVDTHDLLTRIYPYGSGQGDTRLTLAATTRSAPSGFAINKTANYIDDIAATAAYGLVDFPQIEFKDIGPLSNTNADLQAAANMLFDAALLELTRRATLASQRTYTLTIAGCYQLLRPLQTIRVIYRDTAQGIDIDEDLFILEATWELDGKVLRTSRLTVSTDDRWPDSDPGAAAERAVQGKVFTTHPQIGPNSYWENSTFYIGSDQSSQIGEFPFVLGDEVVTVQQVVFRYKVTNPISFISIVTGTTNVDVTVDTVTTTVTVSGTIDISHTHPIPNHQHTTTIAGGSAGTALNYSAPGGGVGFLVKAAAGDLALNTNVASGAVTSSSGGSAALSLSGTGTGTGSGSGTLDLSDAIGVSYGVYRANASQSYSIGELEYRINGGAWVALNTGTLTDSSYYEVDITAQVSDTNTFRPLRENNLIEVRRADAVTTYAITGSNGIGTAVSVSTNPTVHGLSVGEQVTISGTTHHDGTWLVVNIPDTLTFDVNQTGDHNLDFGGHYTTNKAAMILGKLGVRNTIQSVAFS